MDGWMEMREREKRGESEVRYRKVRDILNWIGLDWIGSDCDILLGHDAKLDEGMVEAGTARSKIKVRE